MPLDPFAPLVTPTRPTLPIVVNRIREGIKRAGNQLLEAYKVLQKEIHENKHDYTPEEIVAALGEDYARIQKFAVLVKSVVNAVKPDTIVDSVPEATITMPT